MGLLRQENRESDDLVDFGSQRRDELLTGICPVFFFYSFFVRFHCDFLSYRVKGPFERKKEGLHGGFSDYRALF